MTLIEISKLLEQAADGIQDCRGDVIGSELVHEDGEYVHPDFLFAAKLRAAAFILRQHREELQDVSGWQRRSILE